MANAPLRGEALREMREHVSRIQALSASLFEGIVNDNTSKLLLELAAGQICAIATNMDAILHPSRKRSFPEVIDTNEALRRAKAALTALEEEGPIMTTQRQVAIDQLSSLIDTLHKQPEPK